VFDKKSYLLLTATAFLVAAIVPMTAVMGQYQYEMEEEQAIEERPTMDIVDTAAAEEKFSTLVKALKVGELVQALKEKGPFTVFVPSNEAFQKLPAGALDALLQDRERLRAVLKYHVVRGALRAEDVSELETAETLHGQPLRISTDEQGVMINNARVTRADIQTRNGVIHVIDTVLMPE